MKCIPKALVVASLLALAPLASAEDLSYSYLEAGYSRVTGSPKIDGLTVNGSATLGESFHMFGGYSALELEQFNRDVDLWNLGLGYNMAISERSDLVARVGYQEVEFDNFGSDGGAFVEVGMRSALGPAFEGQFAVGYADADGSGETYARLGGHYRFNPTWGLSADVQFIDSETQVFIGPRITF
jgi:Ax21 family sulfation-dependent quorum factor